MHCYALESVVIGRGITTISHDIFMYCYNLKSIKTEGNIKEIRGNAFRDCRSLKNITIPDTVTFIGEGAFTYSGITEIAIPDSVTALGDAVFMNCSNLTSVKIGKGITEIPREAFRKCIQLKNFSADNITDIADYAFYASGIENITLPARLKSIGDYAFYRCGNIKNISIPANVSHVGKYAFTSNNITEITLHNNLKSIDSYAFFQCNELKKVYYYGKTEEFGEISIGCDNEPLLNANIQYLFDDSYGDVNGDGVTDLKDFIRLKKISAGYMDTHSVNSLDITLLRKILLNKK